MADPHQINSVIATAISECRAERTKVVSTEASKIIAKCVVEQLGDAGFEIVHVSSKGERRSRYSPSNNKSALLIGELLDKLKATDS